MEVFILWFLCAVITAYVALEKNRSALGWFVLGCLSGSFGVILIAYLPKLPSRAEVAADKRAVADFLKPKKQCPECAETILEVARVCRYCGQRFTSEPAAQPPAIAAPALDAHAVPLLGLPSRAEAGRRAFPGGRAEFGPTGIEPARRTASGLRKRRFGHAVRPT
jgi:hypothetical protein